MPSHNRIDILRTTKLLSALDEIEVQTVTGIAEERHHDDQAVVVAQGDRGEAYFVVSRGRAVVTQRTEEGKDLALGELGPGDGFGEVALINDNHRRTATVTAQGSLETIRIPATAFRELLASHPELERRVRAGVDQYLLEGILARSAEFGLLDPARRQWLAAHVGTARYEADEFLMHEGEPGDRCYLIAEGSVAVLRRGPDGEERQVATLGPGSLLGESALLTDAPRTASIRTLEPCRCLTLERGVLHRALDESHLRKRVIEMLRMRAWPRRAPGVELFERRSADGEAITILKHAEHGTYHRLTEQGRFLWDRLDGNHSHRELTLAFLRRFQMFAPDRIGHTVLRLARRGFVDPASLGVKLPTTGDNGRMGLLARAQALSRWTRPVSGLDPCFTRLYRGVARPLFTRPAFVVLVVLTALGAVATFRHGVGLDGGWSETPLSPAQLWAFVPLVLLGILVHEAAHAVAVKHYGRAVDRAGVGLYYFLPIFFVDTSDMWPTRRRPRVMVSVAGLWASALLGSLAALAAGWGGFSDAIRALLWQFTFVSYAIVVVNLNPLLELDGYYILVDVLDRPNLRRDALQWLGRRVGLRHPRIEGGRSDAVLRAYAVGAVLYLLFLCWAILLTHRLFLEDWLAAVLSPQASALIAWGLVVLAVTGTLLALLGELRGVEST